MVGCLRPSIAAWEGQHEATDSNRTVSSRAGCGQRCRPPGNRTPENDECDICSPFLLRQIEVIRPKVIVALGAVAAKNLLAINDSLGNLRGRWYDFKTSRLTVTYHPAYLLRDPRQKKETWKDLQMVMKYLGLTPPAKTVQE